MEDFVTFELAVKLKEKGFPQYIAEDAYIIDNCGEDKYQIGDRLPIPLIPDYMDYIAAPTISQVLKWLRNEKKIWICVNPVKSGFETTIYDSVKQYYDGEYGGWMYYNNLVTTLHFGLNYEDSVIDGIKYVLDNLI